jgi:sarcosine/dimethylglycine N-methyltransferase
MVSHSDIHDRVRAQYAGDGGAAFYRRVMGDGGAAIHYGHYAAADTPMADAVRASTLTLLEMAARHGGAMPRRVIDLGAGAGGSAHLVAERTGAHVTCVDLCPELHAANLRDAEAAGLAGQIETWQGSFDALPAGWDASFDLAWSQDALCHAPDRLAVLREIRRVLAAGGLLVFSDILRDDAATAADVAAFTGVNAVDALASMSQTTAALAEAGFDLLDRADWSGLLRANFAAMLAQIARHRTEMIGEGVSAARIDGFAKSLESRMAWSGRHVMRWVALVCRAR